MLMLSQSFASPHFYNHKTKKSKHLSWLNCQSEEMDLQRKFYFRLCAFFHIWVVVSIGALIKVLVLPDVIVYQDVVRLCLWSWIGGIAPYVSFICSMLNVGQNFWNFLESCPPPGFCAHQPSFRDRGNRGQGTNRPKFPRSVQNLSDFISWSPSPAICKRWQVSD